MLVSAAIDPYRKSYGNSLSRAAMLGGRNWSERITASPRKTCVPGVQAWATAGATTTKAAASQTHVGTRRARRDGRARGTLHPKTLPLSPNRPAQVFQLRLNGIVDRLARAAGVVGHVSPQAANHRTELSPSRILGHRVHETGADCGAEKSRRHDLRVTVATKRADGAHGAGFLGPGLQHRVLGRCGRHPGRHQPG